MDAGAIVFTAFISPFHAERDMAKSLFDADDLLEVFADIPLSIAEQHDLKGLYKKAQRSELPNFTGSNCDYQPTNSPSLILKGVTSVSQNPRKHWSN